MGNKLPWGSPAGYRLFLLGSMACSINLAASNLLSCLFKMLKTLKGYTPAKSLLVRLLSITSEASSKEKWDLMSAISLERKPLITRDLNDMEKVVSKVLAQTEFELSHKSNFEIRGENDLKRAKEVKEGNISITEMDSFPQQTAQDFLDKSTEELNSFKFASRKCDDNIEKDEKSLKRLLDRYLLLIVEERIGKNPVWVLPQGQHKEGETLRQSAERVLQEKCGSDIQAKFMGNAPCGFYKYRYPQSVREHAVGAKIFFFKAQVTGGKVEVGKNNCSDYQWATRKELEKLPYDYWKSVKMFLIDEEH